MKGLWSPRLVSGRERRPTASLNDDWFLRAFGRGLLRSPGRAARRLLSRDVRPLQVLVLAGLALRIVALSRWAVVFDGATMAVMGESLLQHGEFVVPYASGVAFYHNYPPLYPAYLALFYAFLGFSVGTTKIADLALSILFLGVVQATSADLLGRRKAWYVTAFVALEPMFFISTAIGYSEDLVGMLFVLTVWAVIKGIREPRYIVLAGIFAGLGYLSKASLGDLFVVAGLAGLAWRLRFMGLQVFRERAYLGGMSAFGALAGLWSFRDVLRYGWPNWEMSATVQGAYSYAWAHPALFETGLAWKAPWFALIFLFYGGAFLPELRRSWRARHDESVSAMWLTIGLVFVLSWIVSSAFWTAEQTSLWWTDNLRYAVTACPVILWAALREADLTPRRRRTVRSSFRGRYFTWIAVLLVIAVGTTAFPAPYAHVAVLQQSQARFHPGDTMAVYQLAPEAVIPYVQDLGVQVVSYRAGFNGTFILSADHIAFAGYVPVAWSAGEDLTGYAYTCTLWEHASALALGT